ncbi:MAG: S8 family serine peptidase [Candidatus Krumholzibacteriia bacterium]
MRRLATVLIAAGLVLAFLGSLSVPRIAPRGLDGNRRHEPARRLATTPAGRRTPDDPRRDAWHDVTLAASPGTAALASAAPALPPLRTTSRGGVDLADPAGRAGPWSPDRLLADPTHMNDQHVSVVANPATGHLFAVFEARDLGGTDRDIHVAWSTDAGQTWQQRELHPSSLDEFQPDLALDHAGYLHVVWARADGALVRTRSAGPEDVDNWAFVRVFEVGEPVAVPSIAVSGSGDFARVFIACCWYTANWDWYQYEYTLLWLHSTNGGQTVAYDYLYPDGYQDLWPDVALDGAVAYLVNGEQDPYSGRIRILAAADATSGSFVDYVDLSQSTPMSAGYPCVAADGDKVHLAWQLDWDDGLGNIDGDIMYAFSWDGLATVYGPYEIQATLTESVGPAIATADGAVACWWLEAPAGGDEVHLAARAASLNGHPDGWGRTEFVTDQPMVVPQFRAAAGCIGPAGLVATWIDRRDYATEGYNVYVSDRPLVCDLAPYTPLGWAEPLVVNLVAGVREDGELAAGVPAYVSLAVANLGLADAPGPVEFELRLDDVPLAAWQVDDGLPVATAVAVEDHVVTLTPGAHRLALVVDPRDLVIEADEADNTLGKDLWVPSGEPTLELDPPGLVIHADPPASAPATLAAAGGVPLVDPRLAAALARSAAGDRLRVVITPAARLRPADLAKLPRPAARQALRGHAAAFAATLAGRATAPLRSLWLSGELVGALTSADVAVLAAAPGVGRLWLDDRRSEFRGVPAPAVTVTAMAGPNRAPWPLEALHVPEAWAQGLDGAGILVGHTDSGVAWDHPDLAGHLWDGGPAYPHHGYDFLDEDDDPYDPGEGDFWHGTHTAGLVVSGSYGAAPGARLLVARCVPGYYEDMVQALQFCLDQDCRVITTSAGWTNAGDALRSANRINAEVLAAVGIVWVVAAGNGDNAGGHVALPHDISSPGDSPHPWYGAGGHSAVITVGALTQAGGVWSSSSRGPTVWDVAGDAGHDDYPYPPGLGKPDLAAPGADVVSTIGHAGYAAYSGTSMATPLVAGCAAVLLQRNPALTPAELAAALEAGCDDLGAAGRDLDTGAGRLNLPASLVLLPASQAEIVVVRNRGTAPLVLGSVSADVPWLTVSPGSGVVAVGDSLRLTVAWDAAGLTAGGHHGVVALVGNQPGGPALLPVVLVLGEATAVSGPPPAALGLVAYPNPFNPRTTLRFDLASAGPVQLAVFDPRGRLVRRLVDGPLGSGGHEVGWDGRDNAGRDCAAGVYLLRLQAGGRRQTGRVVLVR